jgi:hypothetical protein
MQFKVMRGALLNIENRFRLRIRINCGTESDEEQKIKYQIQNPKALKIQDPQY